MRYTTRFAVVATNLHLLVLLNLGKNIAALIVKKGSKNYRGMIMPRINTANKRTL